MKELHAQIKDRIERYEAKMTTAMIDGEEENIQQVYEDFQRDIGRELNKLAQTVQEPLKSTLLSFFADAPGGEDPMEPNDD